MYLAIQTKSLSSMSTALQEQCLGIIYQALIQTGHSVSLLVDDSRKSQIPRRGGALLLLVLLTFHPWILSFRGAFLDWSDLSLLHPLL